MADNNYLEDAVDWAGTKINTKVRDAFPETKASIIKTVEPIGEKVGVTKESVTQIMPAAAGLAVGTGLLLLAEPISKASKFIFKGARQLVTGFGVFEKIPVIGGLFKTIGSFVEGLSEYAGFGVAAAGAFAAHQVFTPKTSYTSAGETDKGAGIGKANNHDNKITISTINLPGQDVTVEVPTVGSLQPIQIKERAAAEKTTGTRADDLSRPELRKKQLESMHDEKMVEAYRTLMRHDNQLLENRIQFIKDANAFEKGPRADLVTRLEKIGLEPNEADGMVLRAPRFKNREDGDTEKSTRLPTLLEKLGEEFDKEYGQHGMPGAYNWVIDLKSRRNENGKCTPYKWGDLKVTEKVEYLQHATKFINERLAIYENHCVDGPLKNNDPANIGYRTYRYTVDSGSYWKKDFSLYYTR